MEFTGRRFIPHSFQFTIQAPSMRLTQASLWSAYSIMARIPSECSLPTFPRRPPLLHPSEDSQVYLIRTSCIAPREVLRCSDDRSRGPGTPPVPAASAEDMCTVVREPRAWDTLVPHYSGDVHPRRARRPSPAGAPRSHLYPTNPRHHPRLQERTGGVPMFRISFLTRLQSQRTFLL